MSTPLENIGIGIEAWRRLWRLSFLANLVLAGISAVLAIALCIVATRPARVVYFATSPNGVITRLVPLREPLLNDSAVLTRAQEGMTSAFDISYVNWRQDEQQAVKYFTAAGYRSYQATLVKTGDIAAVRERRLNMTLAVTGAPAVMHQQVLANGDYGWQIQMPIRLIYQNSNGINSKDFVANIIMVRVNNLAHPAGVAIQSFNFLVP